MLQKNRTIPYSEFRKAGMKLLLEKTSRWGLIVGALYTSLLVVLTIDLLIWFVIIAAEIFGLVGEVTGAGSRWMTIPFGTGQDLGDLLLLPIRMLPQFWKLDIFLSALFTITALPLHRTYRMQAERARGWKGGSLWIRYFHYIVFFIAFFILFFILALPKFTADSNAAVTLVPLPTSSSTALALLAIGIYSGISAFVLGIVWEWGIFRGLLLLHRTFVFGEDRVRIEDIHSLFTDRDEIL